FFASSFARSFILEKVLFDRLGDYQIFEDLLAESGSAAWVNTPRRSFKGYQRLREKHGPSIASIHVSGKNWGMACNSIHFMDLASYLMDDSGANLNLSGHLHELPCKRRGFIELGGSFEVTGDRLRLELMCE